MADVRDIFAGAIDYRITWCENHLAAPYSGDWRTDACLVIIYTPRDPYHLYLRRSGNVQHYCARNGEALLVPAGVAHRFEAEACVIRGINIQYTLFGAVDVLSFYRVPHYVGSTQAGALCDAIEGLVSVLGRRAKLYATGLQAELDPLNFYGIARERQYAFQLLSDVLDLSEVRPRGERRLALMQRLQPALEYIENNLEKGIPVSELASICGVSAHRLGVLFRETTGVSTQQYILKRRLEKASMLLLQTNESIGLIAHKLGFHDQPHFTKQFKGIFGSSPIFYRKNFFRRLDDGTTKRD
ncbi:MAG: AraC family transcriptional regulator [Pseudomonadales bacterium]